MTFDPSPTFESVPPPYVPEQAEAPVTTQVLEAPRIRWAGIVWGALFATFAATALAILADPARRDALRDAITGLAELHVPPAVIVAVSVVVMGGFLAVIGAMTLTRRARLHVER
jgi:hypothetical protein